MKPRILVVGATPPPYHGCSVMTENLLKSHLSKQFYFIFLDIADRRGIRNIGAFDLTNVLIAFFHGIKFIYLLFRYNPDLVYLSVSQVFWGYIRDLLFLVPARLTKKKILIHLHGGAFQDFYRTMVWPMAMLTRYIFKGPVWGIVLGHGLKSCFAGLIDSRKIYLLPNGIKRGRYNKKSSPSRKRDIHVLYLANLMESKGFLHLFKVAHKIVRRYPYVIFTFAGEQTHKSEIRRAQALISKYHLENFIKMPGVITGEEKDKALADADIFVFPPIAQEGQPLVILEAMAAGIPIISTDRGAIGETVLDGVTGFVVPPGDIDILEKKLLLLIEDKDLRQRMGKEAQRRYLECYTWRRWVSGMEEIFNRVIASEMIH